MGNKEDTRTPLPGDVGHSFEEEDRILNYKPKIEYEEPPQENLEGPAPVISETSPLEEFRTRTQDVINGYKAIEQLADVAQKRIDDRVATGGGLDIQLDPISDAHVIDAIKRCYPQGDPTKITYEMYKACLARTNTYSTAPQVSSSDIQAAKQTPLQTNFGGLSNPPGANRPELSSPASIIKPIDLAAFQAAGAISMFKLLLPMIAKQDEASISQHLLKTPHG